MAQRIESVDILRGITIVAMILVNNPGTWGEVYQPLLHADWHGLTPTDLIFPFFLFIVGISIFFAYKNKPNNIETYKKISIRSLKLIGLGLFLNIFLPYVPFLKDLESLRIPGVLQRIGVVFFFASIIYLNVSRKVVFRIAIFILIGYWLFMGYVPFPDGTLPTFDRAPNNWANYIDLNLLGEHMWKADYDPEGLFSTLPAIATSLFGILIGGTLSSMKHLNTLFLWAIGFLVTGYVMHLVFPINKAIWSSSFVLTTCGWGTLILGLIYYITDVKHIKFGSVFKYAGMNAITIFFLSGFVAKLFYLTKVGNTNIHAWLYDNLFRYSFIDDKLSSLLYALMVVAFYLILSYLMYRKKIFIKV
ncbi:MAG: DUF1624 domain-containing protein [Flavobacteriaceae bacterium]|nr:DUF1624 domain-containing protein [Flavobacteriaceae bacterium]